MTLHPGTRYFVDDTSGILYRVITGGGRTGAWSRDGKTWTATRRPVEYLATGGPMSEISPDAAAAYTSPDAYADPTFAAGP